MIDYIVVKSRRSKHVRIRVRQDGTVRVSAPHRLSSRMIDTFIIEKTNWILSSIEYFSRSPQKVSYIRKGSRDEYMKHKDEALEKVTVRLRHFSLIYGIVYRRVSIRNQRTRWGSCSRSGNLNFNYKVCFLPPAVLDYIVVHELCHIKEFNHSKKFWQEVGKTLPDYVELRKKLREFKG